MEYIEWCLYSQFLWVGYTGYNDDDAWIHKIFLHYESRALISYERDTLGIDDDDESRALTSVYYP